MKRKKPMTLWYALFLASHTAAWVCAVSFPVLLVLSLCHYTEWEWVGNAFLGAFVMMLVTFGASTKSDQLDEKHTQTT